MLMTVGRKIAFSAILGSAVMLASMAFSMLTQAGSTRTSRRIMAETISIDGAAFDVLKQVDVMQGSILGLLIATDIDAIQNLADAFDAAASSARVTTAGLEKQTQGLSAIFGDFEKTDKEVIEIILRGNLGVARQAFVERSSVAADKFRSAIEAGRSKSAQRLDADRDSAEWQLRLLTAIQAISLVLLVVAYSVFAFIIAGGVGKSLRAVVSRLKEIAEGDADLTQKIERHSTDEIGMVAEHYNAFSDKLAHTMGLMQATLRDLADNSISLAANTEETSAAANQIFATIGGVKGMSEKQCGCVENSARAGDELTRGIEALAEMIERQSESIIRSSATIEEMVANVKAVTRSVETLGGYFEELLKASEEGRTRISAVTSQARGMSQQSESLLETNTVIANIATQTNLLAMNAAIEAAHAGHQGRGFAVVADEIRKLAENAAVQSKTTGRDLKAIGSSIKDIVSSSEEADKSFESILSLIDKADKLEKEVKFAMVEQDQGNSYILSAIGEINEASVNVRQKVRESKAHSTTLSTTNVELRRLSDEINMSMEQIGLGTGEINQAVNQIRELSLKNSESVTETSRESERFKTGFKKT